MKKILATLLFVFSMMTLQAQQQPAKSAPKMVVKFITYNDPKEKVSITYPATWEHKPYSTSVFMFMRPVEVQGQKMRENINLVVGPAQDLYLIEYLEDARKKMKESMENFKEIRSEFIKINKIDFVRMVYQFTNRGLVIKSVLYLAVHKDKAYSLTGTALDTTFDKFYPLFQKMADSFRIK